MTMRHTPDNSTVTTGAVERRRQERFELPAGARFEWRSPDGRWHEGTGVTANISGGGALVYAGTVPAVGRRLKLTLTVKWDEGSELRLSGSGVVRHSRRDIGKKGYGADVKFRAIGVPRV